MSKVETHITIDTGALGGAKLVGIKPNGDIVFEPPYWTTVYEGRNYLTFPIGRRQLTLQKSTVSNGGNRHVIFALDHQNTNLSKTTYFLPCEIPPNLSENN